MEYALGCPSLVSPTCSMLQVPSCLINTRVHAFSIWVVYCSCAHRNFRAHVLTHTRTARTRARTHARMRARKHVPCLTLAHFQWQCLQEARLDAPTSSALSRRWLPARLVPQTNNVLLCGVVKIKKARNQLASKVEKNLIVHHKILSMKFFPPKLPRTPPCYPGLPGGR